MYYKIVDAYNASYNINNPIQAMSSLCMTSMRSEIGRLELDRTFEEREILNTNIKAALTNASAEWGLEVLRYEIKDIKPPNEIKRSMEFQAESERLKRSKVLASEGEKQSIINVAEGYKQSKILEGQGKAELITQEARSVVETLKSIGESLKRDGKELSEEALRLRMAEYYVKAMHEIFSEANIVVLPKHIENEVNSANPLNSTTVAAAMAIYKSMLGSDMGLMPGYQSHHQ